MTEQTTEEANPIEQDAARILGSSTRGPHMIILRYLPVAATREQAEAARRSALYQQGDMRLVWVNEGDLASLVIGGRAASYGKRS